MTTFKAIDDRCHFFIMDIIVLFCGKESAGVESDRVSSISEFLAYDDT